MQEEIKKKIFNFACIKDIRYIRNGSIIFHTENLECAIEICNVKLFMGVPVKWRVIWENITSRFLLFNIPTEIPLAEVANDLMTSNNINIFEMRRFSISIVPLCLDKSIIKVFVNGL